MSQSRLVRHAVHGVLIASSIAAFAPVFAADGPPAPSGSSSETVIVTGSRIARTEEETPSPVQVISRDEIEKTGKQNIAEVLRGVGADNQGSIPTSFTAGFAAGSAAVSLRGLGVNSTLVLVNGRRMATYGLADDGSRTFVDLNSIPLEAVDRVEVVKDGASAIYGSDAVAGVINIILKDSVQGGSFGGDMGTSYADDGNVYRVNGSYGFGDPATDRYNVFATVEASKSEAIKQKDRAWLGGDNQLGRGFFDNRQGAYAAGFGDFGDGNDPAYSGVTPYGSVRIPGGNFQQRFNLLPCPEINPGNGVCLFDKLNFYQIQPKQERANIFVRGTLRFTDNMTGYAELGWFHSYTQAIGTPGGVNDTFSYVAAADPANAFQAPHLTTLPAAHPDNPAGVNRTLSLLTTMLGGRNSNINSDVERAIVGVKGNLSKDWTYDVAAGLIQSDLYRAQTGFVRYPVLQQALNDGTFRIDPALNSAALLSQISPTLKDHDMNRITLADAVISGKTFDLPGGPLGIAIGTEYRKEKSDTPPVPFTDVGEIVGLGYSAFKADRTVYAGYVELDAPIVSMLELNAAYRYDHYSDYGHSTTPKVGFKFTPFKQLAVRGTYSEAFRAPGPAENGTSASVGFTNIGIITVGNPDVKPETAKSYTAGIVFEPVRDTSISVDYYKIDRKNEIALADQGTIIGGLPSTGTPLGRIPGVLPGSFIYYDDQGQLAAISSPYTNLAKTTTDGIEADFRQGFDIGDFGKLEISLLWTHVFSLERTLADGVTKVEYAGTHGPYSLSSASGTPQDRGNLEVTWSRDAFALSGRLNYVGSMRMIDHQHESLIDVGDGTMATTTFEGAYYNVNPNGVVCGVYNPDGSAPYGNCKLPYFVTLDLFAKFNLDEHMEITGSISNATNKHAPFDPYTYGAVWYNAAFHQDGAVGRFFNLGAKYRF